MVVLIDGHIGSIILSWFTDCSSENNMLAGGNFWVYCWNADCFWKFLQDSSEKVPTIVQFQCSERFVTSCLQTI